MLLVLLGCRSADVQVEVFDVDAVSDQGVVTVPIDVPARTTAFRLALVGDVSDLLRLESLDGPDGTALNAQDWLGGEQLTFAVFDGPDLVLNWPVREVDGPLVAGTWTARLRHVDEALQPLSSRVSGEVDRKLDPDLRRGRLRAALWVPEGLELGSLDAMIQAWIDALDRIGVDLQVDRIDAAIPVVAPIPIAGDPIFADLAMGAPDADLIAWLVSDATQLGAVGAIPSAAHVGRRSVMVIDAGASAGPDGDLDADDARELGHALAHETGHYAGLFHPVETDWTHRDALEDTPRCADRTTCEQAAGELLMFPYPICSGASCDSRARWTTDQRAVVHRWLGVR